MRQNHVRKFARCLAALLVLCPATIVQAKPVSIEHRGIKLNAEFSKADEKSVADPAILLLHGSGAHHKMETISGIQQALLEHGYSVLAISLSLGVSDRHGMMACDEVHNHLHTDAFDEIDAWLGFLRQSGVRRIILMGHSRGGNQIAWYAREGGVKEIAGIVLLAPATWSKSRAAMRYKERFGQSLDELIERARKTAPESRLKDIPFLACPATTVTARSFLGYYEDEPRRDTPSLLSALEMPVLVVAASEDTIVPDLADRLRNNPAPHVSLSIVDGADHFFLDLFTEDVAAAVHAFIESNR